MKVKFLPVALAIFSLASLTRSLADSNVTAAGLNDMSQLGLGQFSVNVGGDMASNVNSIPFEADPRMPTLPGTFVSSSAPVSLLRMTFNTGSDTTFDWKIQANEANRDSKTSGLFRVPEPTTLALFFAGVGTLLLFRRRRRPA